MGDQRRQQGDEAAGGVRNVSDLVREAAAMAPERTALVDSARVLTWAELEVDVQAAAAGLAEAGVGHGSRVVLALDNRAEFAVSYFGVLRAGGVAVPVNTGYTPAEIRRVLDDSGVDIVLAQEGVVDAVQAAVDESGRDVRTVAVAVTGDSPVTEFAEILDSGRDRAGGAAESPTGGEDLAVMIYTAGTTGAPKGAMLSHRALLANLDQCLALDPPPVSADDVVLVVLPLFHIYGLNGVLGMIARTGATGVLVADFDPDGSLDIVRRTGVTNVPAAPPMYVAWAEHPGAADAFANVRTLVSGAAPLPVPVFEHFRSMLGRPVHEGYGLTETAPVLTTTLASGRVKPGSVGAAVPGVEIALRDEDGDEVEAGDPGEIHVRGANLFSGYWPDGSGGPDRDGWYATGDLAIADEDGDLFLVGRRKELVLVSGFNVYPAEVETVLVSHPAVAEAAVVAVPDARTGEAVKAVVVPAPGESPTAAELRAYCSTRLARFKLPAVIELTDSLPHSLAGKVAKGRLREAAAARGQRQASA